MEEVQSPMSNKPRSAIMLTLALSILLASLGTSVANIALPTLAEAFSAPFAQVQAVVVAYLAALTISVVIAGRLGDHYGMKPMLMGGLGAFAIASLLCGIATNLWLLIVARTLQGIGAAFMMTLSMALMRQSTNEVHLGRAMGLLGTVSALGTALGPSLGGLLIPLAGWRSLFWAQVPLTVIALILAFAALPNEPTKARTQSPGPRSALSRNLIPSLIVNILVAAVMMTTLVVGPFYLSLGLGLKETQVGFIMAIGPVVSIVSGVPSGRLVDSLGSRRVITLGLILLATGASLLAILPGTIGVTGYVLSIIVLTPGYQLFQAANNAAVLTDIPRDMRGTVSGLLNLSRNIGLIAGASFMGAVFAFGAGTQDFVHAALPEIIAGMRLAFLLASTMMMVAIGVTLRHNRSIRRLN